MLQSKIKKKIQELERTGSMSRQIRYGAFNNRRIYLSRDKILVQYKLPYGDTWFTSKEYDYER